MSEPIFEWDPQKAATNERKHGVAFDEARTIFNDLRSMTAYDPDHSGDEDRFLTIGMSDEGRVLLVVHTDRDEVIRLISARLATRIERNWYRHGV
jgi:uncharacterized DUF497 family protein